MSRVFRSLEKTPRPLGLPRARSAQRAPSKDPETLVKEAERQAAEALSSARQEAARLVSAAQSEASSIRRQASEAGYREGFERGFEEGLNKASDLLEQAQAALDDARKAFGEMVRDAEPKMVALALEAAKRVAAQGIRTDPSVLLDMVRRGMDALRDEREFSLRVDPELVAIVDGARDQLSKEYAARSMEVVPDPSVKDGVVVGTPHGFVDVTVESQIRNISAALAEAR